MFCRKTCPPPSSSLTIKNNRLQAAVLAERKRRRRTPTESFEPRDNRRIGAIPGHLTSGKLNAVPAFKAGVKPSQIARQFAVSQTDVRQALASDASKRSPNRATTTAGGR
jgi:hypothetical protein